MDRMDKFAQKWYKECETSYERLVQQLPLWIAIHISANEDLQFQVNEIMATFNPKKKDVSLNFQYEYEDLTNIIDLEIQKLQASSANDTDYDYEDYLADEQYELEELSYYEHDL